MRSFTVATVLALLASAAAGSQVDAVDNLKEIGDDIEWASVDVNAPDPVDTECALDMTACAMFMFDKYLCAPNLRCYLRPT